MGLGGHNGVTGLVEGMTGRRRGWRRPLRRGQGVWGVGIEGLEQKGTLGRRGRGGLERAAAYPYWRSNGLRSFK
eukprot:359160-Chlamydomonas_euryale.AAC.3